MQHGSEKSDVHAEPVFWRTVPTTDPPLYRSRMGAAMKKVNSGPSASRTSETQAQTGNAHRGRMALVVGCEQRLAPVDAWMVCQFVPCLRMVKCDRTILAAGIPRAQAAGRTDNAE
jgi:hypothetical protein